MILITASSFCSIDLCNVFGDIPPVFLPAGNKLFLERQLKSIRSNFSDDIFLSLPANYKLTDYQEKIIKLNSINIIRLPIGLSLRSAVSSCISKIKRPNEMLRILHGDTYIENFPKYSDSLTVAKSISRFYFSQTDNLCWSGYFSFKDISYLEELLDTSNTFEEAVKIYIAKKNVKMLETDDWIDYGNYHSFEQGRLKFLQSRYFNDVTVAKHTIHKKSKDLKKLDDELTWYDSIPDQLKSFTPKTWKSTESDGYFLDLVYGVPLNEWIISVADPKYSIETIITNIKNYLEASRSVKGMASSIHDKNTIKYLAFKKPIDRIDNIKKEVFDLINDRISLNVTKSDLKDIISHCYDYSLANTNDDIGCLHGDLCASNIIFDFYRNRLHVIDPRGGKALGDIRYDIAKIYHSLIGGYDDILASRYEYKNNKLIINNSKIQNSLSLWIKDDFFGHSTKAIKKLCATLFISMIPLHSDDLERQAALLINGINLSK